MKRPWTPIENRIHQEAGLHMTEEGAHQSLDWGARCVVSRSLFLRLSGYTGLSDLGDRSTGCGLCVTAEQDLASKNMRRLGIVFDYEYV